MWAIRAWWAHDKCTLLLLLVCVCVCVCVCVSARARALRHPQLSVRDLPCIWTRACASVFASMCVLLKKSLSLSLSLSLSARARVYVCCISCKRLKTVAILIRYWTVHSSEQLTDRRLPFLGPSQSGRAFPKKWPTVTRVSSLLQQVITKTR